MTRSRSFLAARPFAPLATFLAAFSGLVLTAPVRGGPHEGGVIILHWNPTIVGTDAGEYCGAAGIGQCDDAITRSDLADPVVLHALAAFPGDGFPRLSGLVFGVEYDEAEIGIVDWGACGDFELSMTDWPDSGEGTAVTWSEAQTGYLTQFYWFAAYSYYGNPTGFALVDHPTGGGAFADDSVPANIDPIADFGVFGFFMDGYLPCPLPPTEATFTLVPSEITVYQPCGGEFEVDLHVNDIYSLAAFEVCVGYDSAFLAVDEVVIDPTFLASTGRDVLPLSPVPCAPSCQAAGVRLGAVTTGSEEAPSGSGRLATLRFAPQSGGAGADSLCLTDWELANDDVPPVVLPLTGAFGLDITHSPFCYGDFNGDGDVTVFDLAQIIPRWRCCAGEGCYQSRFDVNLLARGQYCASTPDDCIDIVDIQTVAGRWHLGCGGDLRAGLRAGGAPAGVGPSVRISPTSSFVTAAIGDTTSIAVVVDDVLDLGGFEAGLAFDPAVLQVERVDLGSFAGSTGRTVYAFTPQIDNGSGTVHFGACTVGATPGAGGGGVLVRVVFRIEECDTTTDLELADVIVAAVDGWPEELAGVDGGSIEITCVSDVDPNSPTNGFVLLPPQPNPFSATTVLSFRLPPSMTGAAPVRLDVFTAAGRHVRTLLDRELGTGEHRVEWDARDGSGRPLPAGTYFCRLVFDGRELRRPLQLVR